jgi:hypothetical protein
LIILIHFLENVIIIPKENTMYNKYGDSSELKMGCAMALGLAVVLAIFVFVTLGPAGCNNKFSAWKASAYGSDWLVVQYSLDGNVMNSWDLKDCAVHSENGSDGIYFTTTHGVVHLSGHYLYVQNPTEQARDLYLKKKD